MVLATAMAAVSGTVLLLAFHLQKPPSDATAAATQFSIIHHPRPCISSDGKKRIKKNKKVHFAEDVMEPSGNGEEFRKRLQSKRASVSVMPLSTYLNLGIDKFVFPVDFIILNMPEDVKVPLIFRRLFLSTAHAKIDLFKRNIILRVGDEKIIFKSVKPASSLIKRIYMLSLRERMELDLEARLTRETLVINRSLNPLYEDYIKLNDLNVPLELRRDQIDNLMPTIKGVNRVDMGDIILGEQFCKASCLEARSFDGLIIIHNGSDNVTYQMARSHPRFKHLSNAKRKKIKPLLNVSLHDKLNGISHPYQKLKSFYNGVLNLGPEYVRDAKMKE
nr:uncharacterized protein [Tanacetum cinerariifolium]